MSASGGAEGGAWPGDWSAGCGCGPLPRGLCWRCGERWGLEAQKPSSTSSDPRRPVDPFSPPGLSFLVLWALARPSHSSVAQASSVGLASVLAPAQPGVPSQSRPSQEQWSDGASPPGLSRDYFRPLEMGQKRIFHSQHKGCPAPLSSRDQGIRLPQNISPAATLWASPHLSTSTSLPGAATPKGHCRSTGVPWETRPAGLTLPSWQGPQGLSGYMRDWRPREGCALPEVTQQSAWRLDNEARAVWPLLLPHLPSLAQEGGAHPGRPGAGILGRSLSDAGERGCGAGSDLGAA